MEDIIGTYNPRGWGPPPTLDESFIPSFMKDLPFVTFNKSEKLSKPCDLSSFKIPSGSKNITTPFGGLEDLNDDSEFKLVDSRLVYGQQKKSSRARGYRRNVTTSRTTRGRVQQKQRGKSASRYSQYRSRQQDTRRKFENSIDIKPEWGDPIETFEINKLSKIEVDSDESFEDNIEILMECGRVGFINQTLAKTVSNRSEEILDRSLIQGKTFLNPTSSSDPNMVKQAKEGVGQVFMTDSMWSMLMAVTRSVYSFDLIVTKKNGTIWFDKRPQFDYPSVNENASDPPDPSDPEKANTPLNLSREALMIQQIFSQQILQPNKFHKFKYANFRLKKEENVADIGFVYNRIPINESLNLIIRSEISAVTSKDDNEIQKVLVRTLNEYDPKITGDWKKKLETQRSGVLATELKNNAAKIVRWTCEALLAKCPIIEIGLVSRINPKDTNTHAILDIQSHSPHEFISQMTLNIDQMWTHTKLIIETFAELEDGRYILFRDPNANTLKIYNYPE